MTMKRLGSVVLIAAGLAFAVKAKPPKGGGPQTFSTAATGWTFVAGAFNYGKHPASLAGGGWYFDFPYYSSQQWVGYITTPVHPLYGASYMTMTLQMPETGSPVFRYDTSGNTCNFPAHARFYFQEKGDTLSGSGKYEFYRWWANPVAYDLSAGGGLLTLTVPLTGDQWSSVFGKFGNTDEASAAGFLGALQNTASVGLTFGGGCFFGHGVLVDDGSGTARFEWLGGSAF